MIIKIIIQNSKKPKKKIKAKIKERKIKIEETTKKITRGNRSNLQIVDDAADFRKFEHIEDDIILYCLEKGYGLPPISDQRKRDIWFIKHGILPPLDEEEKYGIEFRN